MQLPYFKHGARINLTSRTFRNESLDDIFYKNFLGGKGIGAVLLYNHLPPLIDPLSPKNIIIFLTGPLTGSNFPGSSRGVMVTKSPLTGTFLDCNIGGSFGKALKSTGFDYLIIEGKSEDPIWIDINDQNIEFRDAKDLWGLSTSQTQAIIKKKLNDSTVEVVTIGQAGEKQVLFASTTCGGRMFGRGGSGAVMGSKSLKAISIRGSTESPWFRSSLFLEEVKKAREKIRKNPMTQKDGSFPKYGTTFTTEVTQTSGVLPTRNWQEGVFEGAEKIYSQAFFERRIKAKTCFQCPIGCSRVVRTQDRKRNIKTEGPEYETIYALGSNCGIDNPDTIIEADLLCEEYGLDTISCGVVISFIMECSERDILKGRYGGPHLKFGDSEGLLETIKLIGEREGVGKLLGRGVKRLSEEMGPETKHFAMSTKGLELPGYDPRGMKAMALLYATSDRGGCHLRGSTLRSELLGLPSPIDRFGYNGKASLVVELQKAYTLMNVFSECLFANFALTLDDYSAALGSLFGETLTPKDLLSIGKRIWDLTRLFNCREGFSVEDDTLPPRLFEDPIPSGPSKGQVIDRHHFESMKDEYYQIQGWDKKTGKPLFDMGRYLFNST
jgi:aldehyde:ferredoxin oxidoreductase